MASERTVLVVGQGAREHALACRLLESESVSRVVVSPGNAGTEAGVGAPPGKRLENAGGEPLGLARELRPDLVVVGPEAPLVLGLVDELQLAGLSAYGPSQRAARLEGSKAYFKEFAVRHGIATGRYHLARGAAEARAAIADFAVPPVIKADGLCAGKGVVVASTREEAEHAALEMLSGRAFGAAGHTIVVEERLVGQELSLHAICDGKRAWLLPGAQDHKRLCDGDVGPNTGGMGTYAPVEWLDAALQAQLRREVLERVLSGMAEQGTPFRGTLFANVMLVEGRDPLLLEINVRFGDPETQVLANVVEADLYEVLLSAANGELPVEPERLTASDRHAVCVVLAAAGYPAAPRSGDVIEGLDEAGALEGARIYHAGTRYHPGSQHHSVSQGQAGRVVTAGGRVLGVTGIGASLEQAQQRAYRAAECIRFAGKQMRHDIGNRALLASGARVAREAAAGGP